MINITEHLSNKFENVEDHLKSVTDGLWDDLNPKKNNGKYYKNSLLSRAENFKLLISSDGYKKKFQKDEYARHLGFADCISNEDFLKKVITSKPEGFKEIIDIVYSFLLPEDLHFVEKGVVKSTKLGADLLANFFKYSTYRSSKHCFNRYLNLNFKDASCPYCNANPIQVVGNNNERSSSKLLFDLDHFYPKVEYPFLALSFYNHLPSCKICNQTYKGSKEFSIYSHIHPFHRCFDSSYQFALNFNVLRNGKVNAVILKKYGGVIDELSTDLDLELRYQSSINSARLPKLVEILSKYSHLLRTEAKGTEEYKRLIESLEDFGLQRDKSKILENSFSKIQRDVVKMFDIKNTIL